MGTTWQRQSRCLLMVHWQQTSLQHTDQCKFNYQRKLKIIWTCSQEMEICWVRKIHCLPWKVHQDTLLVWESHHTTTYWREETPQKLNLSMMLSTRGLPQNNEQNIAQEICLHQSNTLLVLCFSTFTYENEPLYDLYQLKMSWTVPKQGGSKPQRCLLFQDFLKAVICMRTWLVVLIQTSIVESDTKWFVVLLVYFVFSYNFVSCDSRLQYDQ